MLVRMPMLLRRTVNELCDDTISVISAYMTDGMTVRLFPASLLLSISTATDHLYLLNQKL